MMMMRRDATKHVCVACGQLIGIMVQTVSCGVLSNSHTDKCVHATPFGTPERKACYTARQFTGHLGPSCFILVFGVSALCHAGWPRARRCRFEGACALAASATLSATTMQLCTPQPRGVLRAAFAAHDDDGDRRAVRRGVPARGALPQQRGAAPRGSALPAPVVLASFALFIYQHKQPNAFGVVIPPRRSCGSARPARCGSPGARARAPHLRAYALRRADGLHLLRRAPRHGRRRVRARVTFAARGAARRARRRPWRRRAAGCDPLRLSAPLADPGVRWPRRRFGDDDLGDYGQVPVDDEGEGEHQTPWRTVSRGKQQAATQTRELRDAP